MPKLLDLLVDRGVFLDVGVRLRDVRLGLVVVVIGDEVFDLSGSSSRTRWRAEPPGSCSAPSPEPGCCTRLDQPGGRGALHGAGRAQQDDVSFACLTLRSSSSIACGWSPDGCQFADDAKRRHAALDLGYGSHGSTVRRVPDRLRLKGWETSPLGWPIPQRAAVLLRTRFPASAYARRSSRASTPMHSFSAS